MKSRSQKLFPYFMLSPMIVIFGVYLFYPALAGIWYSFQKWDGINPPKFVGIENYIKLTGDLDFWESLARTFVYSALTVPLVYLVALGFALLLTKQIRGTALLRVFFYWPTLISSIIVGLSFRFLLGEDFGVINFMITSLGGGPVKWLTDPNMAMVSAVVASVWSMAGYYMVMFIAGLQAISPTYYEAANIDGATKRQQLFYITFPLLKPTTLLVLVLSFATSIKAYPLVYALTKGGPGSATRFVVQQIYTTAFEKNQMGYASAMAMILFLVLAIITTIQFKLNKGGEQDAG